MLDSEGEVFIVEERLLCGSTEVLLPNEVEDIETGPWDEVREGLIED